ncbi:hypothetical protein D9756_001265 [Leucocoprinus leucothites]|uniref:Uncharacterized protein n=1 Tax=Leucocoprinus leucothites TaxID=201217 RepID=A0A8H5G3S2_9AGAR|nr:hypothetical protein D9756_001265 [Leucoagaricus leucothites]
MLRGLGEVSTSNPLEALDVFYSHILSEVSETALPLVIQVLALLSHGLDSIGTKGHPRRGKLTTRELWLFLRINQPRFYSIMQRLHSVVDIPSPEDSSKRGLAFYHKSFLDYLTGLRRSGRYFVSWDQAHQYQLACSLRWYNLILQFENVTLAATNEHQHAEFMLSAWFRGMPDLNTLSIHSALLIGYYRYGTALKGNAFDSDLFNVLHDFDFSLMRGQNERSVGNILPMLAVSLARDAKARRHFVRIEIRDEIVDPKLLHHLSALTRGRSVEPLDLTAADPFNDMKNLTHSFVIVGNGSKSGLACIGKGTRAIGLSCPWQAIWLIVVLSPTNEQHLEYGEWEEYIVASHQGE